MMMMAMMGNSNCLVHQDRFYVTNETKVNKMERNKESTLPPPHNNKTKLHLTHIEIENDQKKNFDSMWRTEKQVDVEV